MKVVCVILYVVAIGFCVLGLMGHSVAWPAAALSFFAATMMIVGQRKNDKV